MFDSKAKYALVAVCLTMLVSAIGFQSVIAALNIYLAKEPVELRQSLGTIPRQLGEWRARGEDVDLDAAMTEELGTEDYLTRTYVRERDGEEEAIMLHLAYYTGLIDAVPHVPDRCFVAHGWSISGLPQNLDLPVDTSGWRDDEENMSNDGTPYPVMDRIDPITRRPSEVRMPIGDLRLRTSEFRNEQNPNSRLFAGYFFVANGRTTPQPEAIRVMAFNRSEKYAYYLKVQVSMPVTEDVSVDEFLERSGEFMDLMLPEIMRCLPDWAEVEQEAAQQAEVQSS